LYWFRALAFNQDKRAAVFKMIPVNPLLERDNSYIDIKNAVYYHIKKRRHQPCGLEPIGIVFYVFFVPTHRVGTKKTAA